MDGPKVITRIILRGRKEDQNQKERGLKDRSSGQKGKMLHNGL